MSHLATNIHILLIGHLLWSGLISSGLSWTKQDRRDCIIDKEKSLDPNRASEVVGRISGRIIPMCERLGIECIHYGFTIICVADLVELITVALGISRALAFSDSLYNDGAIIVAGFNVAGLIFNVLSKASLKIRLS